MSTGVIENSGEATVVVRTGVFKHQRLLSLDALRGFDMFWIIGGERIFHSMAKATGAPVWRTLSEQFDHAEWHGFRAYDLIFPLFLFMAGVSTPFSIGSELEKGKSRQQLLWRIIRRGLILVLLGIYCNNGLKIMPFSEFRIPSVLGRIGLAWMLANIIYLYARERTQVIWFSVILIGYWLLLKFTAAPGFAIGDLTMQGNFASYIDRLIIPGKLYLDIHDPEGLVSTIPAICTGMLGIYAGSILKSTRSPETKTLWLAGIGAALIAAALLWHINFPINKNLWTSSFVLLTGGLSMVLLSLFYYIIDVLGYSKWAFFFKVIGVNSIMIYVSSRFINWDHATNAFFRWVPQVAELYGPVLWALGFLAVKWAFLYFMYRKKVFLRV
ncbi:MAG: DUF5009 domain-containing protein [Bacteroidota bacterium]